MTAGAYTRLHITPLTPDILRAVAGPALLKSAVNVSYHTIQTFPEKSYGYLELPAMDAEKIKKKLNGAILKGQKIKIEEARPPRKRRHEEERVEEEKEEREAQTAGMQLSDPDTSVSIHQKSEKSGIVISGHALSPDRKVQRGWTEAAHDKSRGKRQSKAHRPASKYSEKEELLFRTTVPPNKIEPADRRKKSERSKHQRVVHEFEKSTIHPSFLKESSGTGRRKANLLYVDGQGWVDEEGHVIEPESETVSRKRRAPPDMVASTNGIHPPSVSTSHSSTKSMPENAPVLSGRPGTPSGQGEDETRASADGSNPASDRPVTQDQIKGPSDEVEPAPAKQPEVHPLEALFKRPSKPASQDIAKPSLEVSTSFSFFDHANQDDVDDEASPPGTPFSSQDIRLREIRSAAPTPDTAHPSRFNSYGSTGMESDEDVEDGHSPDQTTADPFDHDDDNAAATPSRRSHESSQRQSEFEKRFWQNREDNNRAWKTRRRAVLKEKRQRENRARRPKNW